jgi:hypothetical protein
MKKVLFACVAITGALLAAMLYKQVFVERELGPAAMVGASLLAALCLSLLLTLLLYGTRHRALIANLWLAASSVTVSYLVLDVVAGLLLIRPLSPPLVPDEYRHHRLVPNSYAEFRRRDFSYIQRVNSLGLRGREVPAEKPTNSYRIVMLGDSFTMGMGVEDDQTFSVLVERSLKQDGAKCGRSIEVLNAGVDSYAPILSFLQLKRDLWPLKPDMVVLNLDVSDLVQESAYRRESVRGPDGEIVAVPLLRGRDSLLERIRTWTERHLFFTRAALFYANRLLNYRNVTVHDVVTQANSEIVAHTLADDPVDRREQWRAVFDSLVKIKAFCENHGVEFILTVYPWAHQVSDTEWIPGRYTFMPRNAVASEKSANTVRELSASNHIQLIDLFPAFRAYKGQDALYFIHDQHWTPAGHRVVAVGLADHIRARYSERWCK